MGLTPWVAFWGFVLSVWVSCAYAASYKAAVVQRKALPTQTGWNASQHMLVNSRAYLQYVQVCCIAACVSSGGFQQPPFWHRVVSFMSVFVWALHVFVAFPHCYMFSD